MGRGGGAEWTVPRVAGGVMKWEALGVEPARAPAGWGFAAEQYPSEVTDVAASDV